MSNVLNSELEKKQAIFTDKTKNGLKG